LTAETNKNLRCYDSWASVSGVLNDGDNIQDFYKLADYNDKQSIKLSPVYKHRSMYTIGAPLLYAPYIFPANPPLIIDTSAKTIPYLYAVYQPNVGFPATPSKMVWQYKESNSATAQTSAQNWEDVTSQVCSGNSTLSKVKLYRTTMSVQSNSGNIIMKATNGVFASTPAGIYSYMFMCSYGRWHPSGKASVNWAN
jgi:hypothetical protein